MLSLSLMAETLGWAGINEVPVVISLFQRSGPSTGLPTRHGQDDSFFFVNSLHTAIFLLIFASSKIFKKLINLLPEIKKTDVVMTFCNFFAWEFILLLFFETNPKNSKLFIGSPDN